MMSRIDNARDTDCLGLRSLNIGEKGYLPTYLPKAPWELLYRMPAHPTRPDMQPDIKARQLLGPWVRGCMIT